MLKATKTRRPDIEQTLADYGIPDYMQGGIVRYVLRGIPPGHFLSAIIENDLQEAVSRADSTNMRLIPQYVKWFYNNAPSPCWGSAGAVDRWIKILEENNHGT